MKNFLLIVSVLLSSMTFAQGHETFDNLGLTGNSYQNGSFVGQDGVTWTYGQSRGDIELDGVAITLGRNRPEDMYLESAALANGVGTLEFSYMQAFGNDVNLEVLVNDVLVYTATSEGEQEVIKSSGQIVVDVDAGAVIKFNNPNGAQVTLDNIIWTAFDSGGGGGTFPDPYCGPVDFSSTIEPITKVTFAGIENSSSDSTSSPAHEDFTDVEGNVEQGESYDIALEGNTNGSWTSNFTVFIDWNQNGSMDDAGERYEAGTINNSTGLDGQQAITNIAVPADAALGSTRMRVIKNFGATSYAPDSCTGSSWGQAEDYTIVVSAGSGGGGGDVCSQGTDSNNIENGWGNVSLLTYANDFIVAQNEEFTLEQFSVNFLLNPGQPIVSADIFFYEDTGGNGPGAEIPGTSSLGVVPDSQQAIGSHPAGFDLIQGVWTLATPVTFEGNASGETIYWMGIQIEYAGANAFMETSSVYDTPNEAYFTEDGGATWTSGFVNFGDDMHGVVTFSGQCEIVDDGGGGGGEVCSQGTESNDIENGWGNVSLLTYANDFIVAQNEEFTLEQFSVNFLLNPGQPIVSADIFFYEDTGGNGPGAEIPGTSSLGVVPDSQQAIGSHPAGFDLIQGVWTLATPVTFEGNASGETIYWMGIQIEYAGANAFMETSSVYDTPNEAYFTEDGGATWTSGFVNFGADMHGVVTFSGQCEIVDGGGGDEDCAQGDDSNGFENGLNITAGGTFRNADDFIVSPNNTLNVQSIELNIFADGPITNIDVNFYNDENGAPGATVVESVTGLVPYAQVPIGTEFGYTVYAVYVEVDLEFVGGATGTTYWMQPEAQVATAFWEVTTLGTLGAPIHTSESLGAWVADEDGAHAVFKLHCDVATPPDSECLFDITSTVEPITRVVMNNVDNASSVNSDIALEDFTDIIIMAEAGASYDVAFEGYTGGNFTNYFTLFVDLSVDQDWSDFEAIEIGTLVNSTGTDGLQATANITIPANFPEGQYNLRVIKNFGSSPLDPCAAYTWGQGEDYTLMIGELDDCSGTPDAGVASVNPESGNINTTYTVSAVDYSFGNGMTYQWQSNTDGAGWENEGDLLDQYASHTATAPAEYGVSVEWRLEVTCTLSSETSYSETATFTTEMTYCTPMLDCTDGDMITNVNFQEIDNTTTCSPDGYGDYTDMVATVQAGGTYPISVSVGDGWTSESVSVWIDFDNNGSFDEDEFYFIGTGSGEALLGDIIIPADAANGDYRMRVRVAAVGADTATWDMSCDEDQFYGETEDYTVTVDGVVGMDDHSAVTFSYYPNPMSDVLYITSSENVETISAYNVIGQEVLSSKKLVDGKVNVSTLPSGAYMFRVTFENGITESFKVLKK